MTADMIQPNTYRIGDAVDFVRALKGKVAGIVTSPPYNKTRRRRPGDRHDNWNSKLLTGGYEQHDDRMPEADFVEWQRGFIAAAVAAVGDNGAVLYNIGRRLAGCSESLRYEIVQGFPVRQTIIWNRGSTMAMNGVRPAYLPPIYEMVYLLAGPAWKLPEQYVKEMRFWGDVWRIDPERGNPHPAPFPLELAERLVKLVDGPVADPFAGSGTTGLAAKALGYDYYLNDLSPEYKEMFERRLAASGEPESGLLAPVDK